MSSRSRSGAKAKTSSSHRNPDRKKPGRKSLAHRKTGAQKTGLKNTRRGSATQSARHQAGLTPRLLARIWYQWRDDNKHSKMPLALDKWLKQRAAIKSLQKEETQEQRWLLQQAMIDSQRYQHLACALESAYQQDISLENRDTLSQWLSDWDEDFSPAQFDQIDADDFWYWVSLRSQLQGSDWSHKNSNREQQKKREQNNPRYGFFQQLRSLLKSDENNNSINNTPINPLNLLWYGLRPMWQTQLAERALFSSGYIHNAKIWRHWFRAQYFQKSGRNDGW